ncbi:MAG: hypothetical protein KC502_09150 [Myxococcales bacterium]|nr:hypothetical protein [Myxococcales bacterium]
MSIRFVSTRYVSALSLVGFAIVAAASIPSESQAKGPLSARKVLMKRAISPAQLKMRLVRYPAVRLTVPGRIPDDVVGMLPHLRRAADAIDRVYWQQSSASGVALRAALKRAKRLGAHDLAKLFLEMLELHYGPWDRHHDDDPFLGHQRRPPGANFYPADISRREIDTWVKKEPTSAASLFSPYTIIRRSGKKLVAIPYSKAYAADLKVAAHELRHASGEHRCVQPTGPNGGTGQHVAVCRCAGLSAFLKARATSLLNDDYLTSEVLWLGTGACPLDIVIGPYEYYEDRLMGLKTSFESIIYLRDERESRRFERLAKHHKSLIDNLPLPADLKPRFELTKPSPITIGNVLYTAGDARSGYQIRAFVLPNDERVRRARGTKNVILKNVVQAKYDALALPVAKRIFDRKLLRQMTFDAYFDVLLAWQFAHGIQASRIELPGGERTTARKMLRARYPLLELVKGEAIALLNFSWLVDKGVFARTTPEAIGATFLAGFFDSMRLGRSSPQTTAKSIIYNYLAKEWVFRYNPASRTFEVNGAALKGAVRKLVAEVLQIIGRGDYGGAGRLILQYGIAPGEVRAKLSELGSLPMDIKPVYASMPKLDAKSHPAH